MRQGNRNNSARMAAGLPPTHANPLIDSRRAAAEMIAEATRATYREYMEHMRLNMEDEAAAAAAETAEANAILVYMFVSMRDDIYGYTDWHDTCRQMFGHDDFLFLELDQLKEVLAAGPTQADLMRIEPILKAIESTLGRLSIMDNATTANELVLEAEENAGLRLHRLGVKALEDLLDSLKSHGFLANEPPSAQTQLVDRTV